MTEIPEGEERENRTEVFEEIMTKIFPKLVRDTKQQIQEIQKHLSG